MEARKRGSSVPEEHMPACGSRVRGQVIGCPGGGKGGLGGQA